MSTTSPPTPSKPVVARLQRLLDTRHDPRRPAIEQAGYTAGTRGGPWIDNPYSVGSDEQLWWHYGWKNGTQEQS